jgi:DNA ligase-associated metallophosphoesterase
VPDSLDLELAGEPMRLLADRALYWPARRRLLISDLHLGKGDTFRAAGIAVPTGGTAHDLARLESLLAASGAHALWILGDFLHARRSAAVDRAWRRFRDAHARVAMAVIPGNHDLAFDATAAGVDHVREGIIDGPFELRHAPTDEPSAHVICGHIHPVLRLPGAGRHPLFWLRPGMSILPAFSAFTGGYPVARGDSAGSVICDGRQLLRLAPA